MQDERSYVGNSMLWWAKDHHGYTTDVDKAHIFTAKEALKIVELGRGTDIPWSKKYIDKIISKQVDMQYCDLEYSGINS